MKFKPPAFLRVIRYVIIGIAVVFPPAFILRFWNTTAPENRGILILECVGVFVLFALMFWFGLVRRMFSSLQITADEICLQRPFKKKWVMATKDCAEVGSYFEIGFRGGTRQTIYFSDHKDVLKEIENSGHKSTNHLIKFYYTEELRQYIVRELPNMNTKIGTSYCFGQELEFNDPDDDEDEDE